MSDLYRMSLGSVEPLLHFGLYTQPVGLLYHISTGFSRLEVPERALDGIPLGLGLVVKIIFLNFHVDVPPKHLSNYRMCM